ncbi:cyclin-like protein [Cristinia sonorae]|uniref:Cyclin-like protein n=1 Tax=Cristinia sonorae TaxID=1940300 RepID=A0A8K0UWX6_9AGAR|nr:cyclin-like protein [Cristinia sonorae]
MDAQLGTNDSPFGVSTNQVKYHLPYFTPAEVEQLSEKQRGKLSVTQEERARQLACGFIENVGAKLGFPRRTIATAQNLYHRFHLFFPRNLKDLTYHDVCLAAIYVSSKMHDTLKKPREILMVSYAIQYPEFAAKSKVAGELDIDPNVVEHDRQSLLKLERAILETVCFNFTARMPFPYVIKVGHAFKATKKLTKLAWRLAIDSNRTLVNLQYPPHVVALASLYLASLLTSFEQGPAPVPTGFRTSHEIADILGRSGDWERKFQCHVQDLQEIAHPIIDLFIQAAQNPLTSTSPTTPSSPHPTSRPSTSSNNPASSTPAPYNADQLMRLKIVMRESEYPPRPRLGSANVDGMLDSSMSGMHMGGMGVGSLGSGGRSESGGVVTTRFMFAPPGMVEDYR